MFNKNSLRLALSGSILIILLGSLTACSDEGPTAPTIAPQHEDVPPGCIIVGGQLVCV